MLIRPPAHGIARAVTAALVTVVAAWSAVACGGDEPSPAPTRPPAPKVSFTADFTSSATGLRWEYRVRNDESVPLVLFNGPDADHPDDGPALWITRRDDGTAEVAQRLLGQPGKTEGLRPILVHGTVLPPGREVTGTAEATLPLTVRHPYEAEFKPPLPSPEGAERAVFCLGVARESEFIPMPTPPPTTAPATAGTPTATAAPPGPLYAHLTGSLHRQHLLCSAPATLPG